MTQIVEQVVEGVNARTPARPGIKIGDVWYNHQGPLSVSKGDVVSFDYVVNAKGYKDIVKGTFTVAGAGAPAAAGQAASTAPRQTDAERQRQIMLQSAAKIVAELYVAGKLDPDGLSAVAAGAEQLADFFGGKATPEQLSGY